ncbi:MAG: diguanylate cyclase, partial [Synergistaceae bacterium]|nr:diguanylate cyclase [Synergistaceae bacterium]
MNRAEEENPGENYLRQINDLSEEELREELRRARERIDVVYRNTTVSLWDYDIKNRRIIHQRRSIERHGFGFVIENVPQSLIESGYVHPDYVPAFLEMYDRISAGEKDVGGTFRVRTADRSGYCYERISYSVTLDENGLPDRAIGVSTDVSEEMERKKEAESDSLTSLLNHGAFMEQAASAISRQGEGSHFLLLFDLDDFKGVNDSYGHITGDRVISRVGKCVREISARMDKKILSGRVGGDEFALLLCNAERGEAEKLAKKLVSEIPAALLGIVSARVSVGAAEFPKDASTFDELYMAADRACYHVKRNGKGTWRFYDAEEQNDEETLRLRQNFLSDTVAGGMMGGYLDGEGHPFYFIDAAMLRRLGYDSEEEFVRDIGGLVVNCIHPDDREHVHKEVDRQLSGGRRYAVDYRIRKKNGSYIWVHDIGERVPTFTRDSVKRGHKPLVSL